MSAYLDQFRFTPMIPLWKGQKEFDRKLLLRLPDPEFRHFYLESMTEYRDMNGWWGPDKPVFCGECNLEIPGPEFLRRLYGRTLDPECFRKVYNDATKHDGPMMKRYWDRVAELDLTNTSIQLALNL